MPDNEGGVTGFTRKVIGVRKFWKREPAAPSDIQAPTDNGENSAQYNPKEFGIDKPVNWKSETPEDSPAGSGAISGDGAPPQGDSRFGGQYSVAGVAHRYAQSDPSQSPESDVSAGAGATSAHELGHVSQQGAGATSTPDESASQIPVIGSKTGMTDDSEEAGHTVGLRHEHVRPESGADSPADMHAAGSDGQDSGSTGWSHFHRSFAVEDAGAPGRANDRLQTAGPVSEAGAPENVATDAEEPPVQDGQHEVGHWQGLAYGGSPSPAADAAAAGSWSHIWQGAESGERPGAGAYIGRNDGTVQPSESDSAAPVERASDAAIPQDETGGLQGPRVPPGEGAPGSAWPGFQGGVRVASGDLNDSSGGDADLRVRVGAEPGSGGGSNEMDLQDTSGGRPEAGSDASTSDLAGNEGSGDQATVGISYMQSFRKVGDGAATPWRPNPQRVSGDTYQLGPDTQPEQDPAADGTHLTAHSESAAAINRTGDRSFSVDETGVIRGEPPNAETDDLSAPEPHGTEHLMPSTLADLSVDQVEAPDALDAPDLDGLAEIDHHDLASNAHDLLDR